ncbi:hypothetical protein CHUAL_011408 [Chamberlinius hualienensis]
MVPIWTGLSKAYQVCKTHFYKVLVLSVIGLMALQYALSVTIYGGKSYFLSGYSLSLYSYKGSDSNGHSIIKTDGPEALAAVSNLTLLNLTKSQNFNLSFVSGNITSTSTSVMTNFSTQSSNQTLEVNTTQLPLCPPVPSKLVGQLKVLTESPTMAELEARHPELSPGGRFHPKECTSRHKVAIIIPYRDRERHLRLFLNHLHPILQRQQLDYGIYVIEEAGTTKFNRAMLMNIGFVESLKHHDFGCFIFHDVDLLPENDLNIYSCPEQPRHMSVAVDTMNYKLPYADIFGGVSALSKQQMEKVNGFSNEFWGWGGEDDDMSNRIRYYGYKISRYQSSICQI